MELLNRWKVKRGAQIEDILLAPLKDRRLLSDVPDKEALRTNIDRRGKKILENEDANMQAYIQSKQLGVRYQVNYAVEVNYTQKDGKKVKLEGIGTDISTTGILIKLKEEGELLEIKEAKDFILKFEILPGTMPEGYEMKVRVPAVIARSWIAEDSSCYCAFEFLTTLAQYASRKKGRVVLIMSSLLLLFITVFILLMRAESILYFKFNKYLYLYSIVAATFLLSRYLFGALYRPMDINTEFTPGVTIIIPCFNEENWIERTINSCMNQDYPIDKLEVIVVDDCSNDNSVEAIKAAVEKLHKHAGRFKTEERLKYVVQEKNGGKREALARGALMAKHELVVFVDSDSFLDPYAIRNLVQPFQDPKMGGVSGRTDVANTYTNALTKMQSVRYYIAFRIMKSAEAYFDAVTCLSGPLSCYRKDLVLHNMKDWLNQKFLGQKATFGDDRSLTNFILRKYRTTYQDSAVCYTIVPNSYKTFLKQQMRWKRSWLRESIIAGSFIWKKEPFTSLFFYMGLVVPIAAPVVVLYNLIYVPVMHRVLPTTFLVGLLMMSLLMSFTQLFYRKSTTWLFGMLFCIYYEAVLLWQMPVAWVTFWKSTWGTRMTPEDMKEEKRKAEKRDVIKQKQGKKKG